MTALCSVRSLALRPRFSTGLPLSVELCKVPTKRAWFCTRLAKIVLYSIFGNLAVITAYCSIRPLALRPRFSTGLLLSDSTDQIIATGYRFLPFVSVRPPCIYVNLYFRESSPFSHICVSYICYTCALKPWKKIYLEYDFPFG